MGNPRWHQNRSYNREENWRWNPRSHDTLPPPHRSSGFWHSSVPSWEKQFCSMVGSVQWSKIVDAKKYMHFHQNILDWDDSACEEAFQNAKQRFWAQINGFPCGLSLPDPDIYIDMINYDAYVDPELILDLDREYVDHDVEEEGGMVDDIEQKNSYSVSVHVSGVNIQDNCENPWARKSMLGTYNNGGGCWDQWDIFVNDSRNVANNDNPWERTSTQNSGDVKENAWGDFRGKSWAENQGENHTNQSFSMNSVDNPWEQGTHGARLVKGKGWNDATENSGGWNSWGCGNNGSRNWDTGDKPWEHSFTRSNEAPKDRSWREWGGNSHRWKHWDNSNNEPKNSDEGWGAWNGGGRKREGSHQDVLKSKSSRFQGDDPLLGINHQTNTYWRKGRTRKRVSFAFE